jgi:hypothetical protein
MKRSNEEIKRRRLVAPFFPHLPYSDPFDRICRGG